MTRPSLHTDTDIFLETHILRMRIVAFVIGFAAATFFMVAAAKADDSLPPVLKEQITVSSNVVTLGDLFDHAGQAADMPVFRSPDLGAEGLISAERVTKAAKRHGLVWPNLAGLDKISIRRRGRLIAADAQKALVKETLAIRTKAEDANMLDITFAQAPGAYFVDPESRAPVVVKSVTHSARTGNFNIVIGLQGSDGVGDKAIRGRAFRTALIHVPRRQLPAGATIGAEDLKEVRYPLSKLTDQVATRPDQIVGQSPKRSLRANDPVRLSELQEPRLVAKNSLVDIAYQRRGLSLKAEGRAIEGGALGDTVKVINTHSRKTVIATVTGHGRVSVARPDAAPRARRVSAQQLANREPVERKPARTQRGWEAIYRVR